MTEVAHVAAVALAAALALVGWAALALAAVAAVVLVPAAPKGPSLLASPSLATAAVRLPPDLAPSRGTQRDPSPRGTALD